MTQNNPPSPRGRPAIKGGLSPADEPTVAGSRKKPTLLEEIDKLVRMAARLKKMTPTDDELADAAGIIREVEVSLAETRRRWESLTAEMPPIPEARHKRVDPLERAGTPVARGQRFELVPQGKNVYSFNTPAILVAAAEKIDGGPVDALMDMVGAGAITLKFGIKAFTKYCTLRGITVVTGAEAVTDDSGLDAPMVGKVWKDTGTKRVPIKEGTS